MKYFKMLIIIALMCTAIVSGDPHIDKICIIGLTAFALSSVLEGMPSGSLPDFDDDHGCCGGSCDTD